MDIGQVDANFPYRRFCSASQSVLLESGQMEPLFPTRLSQKSLTRKFKCPKLASLTVDGLAVARVAIMVDNFECDNLSK